MTAPFPLREKTADPPHGVGRWRWYGPAFIWMVSAVGSGEILFTPRVGSRYGYVLVWAALAITLFMWAIIREVGRFTAVTGKTILAGFGEVPGPANWAIWIIAVPQAVAAVVTIAGISSLVGSALMIALPGSQTLYALVAIGVSAALVLFGGYPYVERIGVLFGAVLAVAAVAAAAVAFPSWNEVFRGVVPGMPEDLDLYFILPWIGFYLAGAAGLMWFSYWTTAKGYGAGENPEEPPSEEIRVARLREWTKILSTTAAIGVVGGSLITLAFLVLGAELLGPRDIVPEGIRVAEDLTKLFSTIWGQFGHWLLLVSIIVAFWGTVIANQDGWGRLLADATALLAEKRAPLPGGWGRWLLDRARLKKAYVVVIGVIIPAIIVISFGDPVDILSVGGIIAAAHTPVVVFLALYLNRARLPRSVRPGPAMTTLLAASGVFYGGFAILYLLDQFGVRLL